MKMLKKHIDRKKKNRQRDRQRSKQLFRAMKMLGRSSVHVLRSSCHEGGSFNFNSFQTFSIQKTFSSLVL